MSNKFRILGLAVLALALFVGVSAAQEKTAEVTASVPEFTAFHEVIQPMWHTAYPAKDGAALRGLVPRMNELAAKVYAAKLPAILHEKEDNWITGLEAFRKSVDDYNKAAEGKDDAVLLTAAETLHAKYEGLGRVIRPVLAEVGAFHQALYPFVHQYAPENKYDKIRGGAADLLAKAEAVAKVTLPARQAAKAEAFKAAAAALVEAAKALAAAADGHDHDGMVKGVETLHTKYQALEAVFE
ncbi:MAG: hypothetical protein PHI34_03695 [Acidobacteriota bacterium]|nr:hypothetical protein [Acidobacteriota bacterium]